MPDLVFIFIIYCCIYKVNRKQHFFLLFLTVLIVLNLLFHKINIIFYGLLLFFIFIMAYYVRDSMLTHTQQNGEIFDLVTGEVMTLIRDSHKSEDFIESFGDT